MNTDEIAKNLDNAFNQQNDQYGSPFIRKLIAVARAALVLDKKEGYGTEGNEYWDALRESLEDLVK